MDKGFNSAAKIFSMNMWVSSGCSETKRWHKMFNKIEMSFNLFCTNRLLRATPFVSVILIDFKASNVNLNHCGAFFSNNSFCTALSSSSLVEEEAEEEALLEDDADVVSLPS